MIGNMVTVGEGRRRVEGADARLGSRRSRSCSRSLGTTLLGMLFGAVASRSFGIYFLMITLTFSVIAFYFVGQVTVVSGFSGIGGIDSYTPGVRRRHRHRPQPPVLHRARRRARRLRPDPLHRAHAVRRLAAGDPRRAGADDARSGTSSRSTARSRSASPRSSRRWRGSCSSGGRGRSPGRRRPRRDDRPADRRGDRRARAGRGRLGRRVRLHRHQQLHP